jgi:UDP-N-acetylmuramate--alanine ligase
VDNRGSIHIVGIAGSGMCAAAEVSLACGYRVSGSDRYADRNTPLPMLNRLRAAGCVICSQDGSGITPATDAVVISTAIEADNPDLIQARARLIPIYHRTEWLQRLIGSRKLLGIAGTSGKSTVTAMVGWILEQAGMDPFVVNGAAVAAWEQPDRSGQVRFGSDSLWVLELDESDRSLLRFTPQHAVITNQSADHFPLSETAELFTAFQRQVRGACVTGPWDFRNYTATLSGCCFDSDGVQYQLPLMGVHNAQNALAASALCHCVGIPPARSAAALRAFPGVRRRLERCEPSGSIAVFDDFAHNPAKIAAAIDAVIPFAKSVTVIWRPHGYGPLRSMMTDLVDVFGRLAHQAGSRKERHRLLLLPVYDVGGTAARDVQCGDLAVRLKPSHVETLCLATYDEVLIVPHPAVF